MFPQLGDKFYEQFDDPARAYSNLPSLYQFYLDNPDHPAPDKDDMNHIVYAYNLASQQRKDNGHG